MRRHTAKRTSYAAALARDLWAGNRCGAKNGQVIHQVLRPTPLPWNTLLNLRLFGDFYVLQEHVEPPARSCYDCQYGFDRLYTATYKGIGSKDPRRALLTICRAMWQRRPSISNQISIFSVVQSSEAVRIDDSESEFTDGGCIRRSRRRISRKALNSTLFTRYLRSS